MRILFVHRGPSTQWDGVGPELVRRGHEVTVATTDEGLEPRLEGVTSVRYRIGPGHKVENVRTHHGDRGVVAHLDGVERAIASGLAVRALVQRLEEQGRRFDVIVAYGHTGTSTALRGAIDVPVVTYMELPDWQWMGERADFPPDRTHRWSAAAAGVMSSYGVASSEAVFVPSEYARGLFAERIRHRVFTVPDGVIANPHVDTAYAREQFLDDPDAGPVVALFAHTMEAFRGGDVFLQIAVKVRAAYPKTRILVVGKEETRRGTELPHLDGESFFEWSLARAGLARKDLKWFEFLPFPRYQLALKAADVAVFPFYGGAGVWGLYHAMAAGLAIVGSNRAFIPEAIRHEREGLLADPDDVERMTRSVLDLVGDAQLRARLGHAAFQRWATVFSLPAAASRYETALAEVVDTYRERGRRR